MNKSQIVYLWIGVIAFLFYVAYSVARGLSLSIFFPITLAIIVFTGANIYTCGLNIRFSKTILIIINVAIIVALVIFIILVYLHYEPPNYEPPKELLRF